VVDGLFAQNAFHSGEKKVKTGNEISKEQKFHESFVIWYFARDLELLFCALLLHGCFPPEVGNYQGTVVVCKFCRKVAVKKSKNKTVDSNV